MRSARTIPFRSHSLVQVTLALVSFCSCLPAFCLLGWCFGWTLVGWIMALLKAHYFGWCLALPWLQPDGHPDMLCPHPEYLQPTSSDLLISPPLPYFPLVGILSTQVYVETQFYRECFFRQNVKWKCHLSKDLKSRPEEMHTNLHSWV